MAQPDHECWLNLGEQIVLPVLDCGALAWACGHSRDVIGAVIATGRLAVIPLPDWSEHRRAMDAYFGLGSPGHCLAAEPHRWSGFHEPQITEGLAYFLNAARPAIRHARIRALLEVLDPDGPRCMHGDLRVAAVAAEATGGRGRRIDLLVWAETARGDRCAAVLEAKFEHTLSAGQLKAYEQAARTIHGLSHTRTTFAVVAPSRTRSIGEALWARPAWRFLSWRRLIVHLEPRLAELGCDEPDFARFRRTIWERAGR